MNENSQIPSDMFAPMLTVLKMLSVNEEIYATTAKLYYQLYTQLIGVGFSEEQAMQIVVSANLIPGKQ